MEETKKMKFTNKPIEELNQLAKDIFHGSVFTDRHIRESNKERLIGSIFMPLIFGGIQQIEIEGPEGCALLYEYYNKAISLCVNGYPIFISVQMLNEHDANFVFEKVKKMQEAIDSI
jgi:hypothetical protein